MSRKDDRTRIDIYQSGPARRPSRHHIKTSDQYDISDFDGKFDGDVDLDYEDEFNVNLDSSFYEKRPNDFSFKLDESYDPDNEMFEEPAKPVAPRRKPRRAPRTHQPDEMTEEEVKALEAKREKERILSQKRITNHKIMSILYGFVFLFIALIGYFIYFDVIKSEDVTNNPNNIRIAKLSDTVIRGSVLASNGDVIVSTQVDDNGNETRYYPYENIFAHVVGNADYNKIGIESSSEYYLLQSNINPVQKIVNDIKGEKSQGDSIVTTLNVDLQKAAYKALGDQKGVVVAMEPSTGKILAMVSKPDYNPNTLAIDFEKITADVDSKVLLNQATQGRFTPGSIFKLITTLEYLRENGSLSNYQYNCEGRILLDSYGETSEITCYKRHVHGQQGLMDSFANSCNSSYAHIGLGLSIDKMNQLCDELYFNKALPCDLPHAKSTFTLTNQMSEWEIGATAIGQGQTTMTPLHALMLTSAIANGGQMMKPYLMDSIKSADGRQVDKFTPQSAGTIMTAEESLTLSAMMEAVVDYGTATGLNGLGFEAAGKTGTAEVTDLANNAWFVGYAPANNPQIAICVLVEDTNQSSSTMAVPIAKTLFQTYLQ